MQELELFGTRVKCEDISGLLLCFKAALGSDSGGNDSVNSGV